MFTLLRKNTKNRKDPVISAVYFRFKTIPNRDVVLDSIDEN